MEAFENNQKITGEIFKNGLLLSYTIGFWDGKMKQDQDDVATQNANVASEVYEKGTKLLLPAKSLQCFYGYRSRLGIHLSRYSFAVPGLRGSRFIPKGVYDKVKTFMQKERDSFMSDADDFIKKYPEYQAIQIAAFNKNYPHAVGKLDRAYPSPDVVRARFVYDWMPYAWDYVAIEEIEKEAKETLSVKALEMVHGACVTMREQLHDEILGVLNVVKNAKHQVNVRTVAHLKERIDALKQVSVFGDKRMDEILNESSSIVDSMTSWDKESLSKNNFEVRTKALLQSIGGSIKEAVENPFDEISSFRLIRGVHDTPSDDSKPIDDSSPAIRYKQGVRV